MKIRLSNVLGGQRPGDAAAFFLGILQIGPAVLRKQDVQQVHLGDSGGNGAALQGIFVGAALQHQVGQVRAGGIGEPGDQNHLSAPRPRPPSTT